jgi:DNA-binding ferritin-like protein (Dps family)
MSTVLAEQYKILSGFYKIDIDKLKEEYGPERYDELYNYLIWHLPRGIIKKGDNDKGKQFANIVCNLAKMCSLDTSVDDVNGDGVVDYYDQMIKDDIDFANKVLNNYTDLDYIRRCLLINCDDDEDCPLVTEDGQNTIICD